MSFEALDVFEQMQPLEVQWLLATAELVLLEAGDVILREGEPPSHIFFVADGQLEITVYSGHGSIVHVGRMQPGDVVGEISWLDAKPASGSVRAIEMASVLRLPTTALDAKLRTDPVFAAHFLRGIAKVLAERLRKTTQQLRTHAGVDALDGNSIARCLAQLKDAVAAVEKEGEHAAPSFESALHALDKEIAGTAMSAGTAEAVRQDLRPIFSRSAIGLRCISRPRGYATDYATLEMIHAAQPNGADRTGKIIDAALLNYPTVRAIRGRGHMMKDALRREIDRRVAPVHVTCLGAGAAPEVFELLEDATLASRAIFTCVDVDREAVAVLNAHMDKAHCTDRVTALHANILHLATGRDDLGLEPQQIIYSCGLLDVLADDTAVALLNWCHQRLSPNGILLMGAIGPDDSSSALLKETLDWQIKHRSAADLKGLLQRSQFDVASAEVIADLAHPGIVLLVTKI